MNLKKLLLATISVLIISTTVYAFDFPKTEVTIMGHQASDEIIELHSIMFSIEIHSLNQLKSVKLQIDDKKPRTICRNNCWDYQARKPVKTGVHNIKIILENYESQIQEHSFILNVRRN